MVRNILEEKRTDVLSEESVREQPGDRWDIVLGHKEGQRTFGETGEVSQRPLSLDFIKLQQLRIRHF